MSRHPGSDDRRIRLEEEIRQLEGDLVRHAARLKDDAVDMARPGRLFKRYPVQTVAAGLVAGALLAWGASRLWRGRTFSGAEVDDSTAGSEAAHHESETMRHALRAEIKRAIARQAAQFLTTSVRDAIQRRDGERQPS